MGEAAARGFSAGGVYGATARSLDVEGAGVCDIGGYVVFARGLLPGESAKIRLTDARASYAKAELAGGPDNRSPDRIAPQCPHFGLCGGCQLMHMTYAAELEHKRRLVEGAFHRIAGLRGVRAEPTVGGWDGGGADFAPRYRNKGRYSYSPGLGRFGFNRAGSHEVVPVRDCLLQKGGNAAVLEAAERWAAETGFCGSLCGATIRTGEHSGEAVVILETKPPDAAIPPPYIAGATVQPPDAAIPQADTAIPSPERLASLLKAAAPNVKSVVAGNCALFGDGSYEEEIGGLRFRVSGGAFFQVNARMAGRLFGLVEEMARPAAGGFAVDLYCGTGTLSAFIARSAGSVVGVESHGASVRDARGNAARNGLRNLSFVEARAEDALPEVVREAGRSPCLVALDPPRRGCGPALIGAIREARPERVIYVSCDPATLGRDAARLCSQSGATGAAYRVARVVPVDMFARTANVEAVALFERCQ